jgi:hypothetical protein
MLDHRWFRVSPERLVSCRADWLRPDIVAGLTTGAVTFITVLWPGALGIAFR